MFQMGEVKWVKRVGVDVFASGTYTSTD